MWGEPRIGKENAGSGIGPKRGRGRPSRSRCGPGSGIDPQPNFKRMRSKPVHRRLVDGKKHRLARIRPRVPTGFGGAPLLLACRTFLAFLEDWPSRRSSQFGKILILLRRSRVARGWRPAKIPVFAYRHSIRRPSVPIGTRNGAARGGSWPWPGAVAESKQGRRQRLRPPRNPTANSVRPRRDVFIMTLYHLGATVHGIHRGTCHRHRG